jgi:hypothetical protein
MARRTLEETGDRVRIRVARAGIAVQVRAWNPSGEHHTSVSMAEELMRADVRMEVDICWTNGHVGRLGPTRVTVPCARVEHQGSAMCISGQHRLVHAV